MTQLQQDRADGVRGEEEVASIIAEAWKCEVRRTPLFTYYDYDLDRNGRTVAIAEVKTRRCTAGEYEDTFLALDKWYRLVDISRSLEVRGIYIVNFLDEIRFIEVGQVDARRHRVCGRTDRPSMPHDISTKILVPVAEMRRLEK